MTLSTIWGVSSAIKRERVILTCRKPLFSPPDRLLQPVGIRLSSAGLIFLLFLQKNKKTKNKKISPALKSSTVNILLPSCR
ncbi:hypothetical protein Barb6XT_01943 [Bacteroidales bacterium Barb6XT]|nr:hypothetical protein Barb6XT_01943 [Bacteroidales bacterium Barb6XT]